MASQLKPLRIAFDKMAFRPDIPSQALGPNEYNAGSNIELNNRGLNSVLGDKEILSQIPGNVIYLSSGFRDYYNYWFIAVTVEGKFYGITDSGITNLTPGYDPVTNPDAHIAGYTNDQPITDCWNAEVLFINDGIGAPYYLIPEATQFRQYGKAPDNYIWNYNPAWTNLAAGFLRLYSTPNVGSILVAGNLTATTTSGTIVRQPGTVRWSQAFGVNAGPTTWAPTITNVANELEVPVEGPVVDGFPSNGNFIVCSYWDSVIFSPIAYQSTSAPILGLRPLNLGRGLLNENCWANADNTIYGLDARDIWVYDGTNFNSLGNQQVRDYFFANLNPLYASRIHIANNTYKNQIEIYYPDLNSTGWCNKMLAYRYDLQVFQPPRDITNGSGVTESPRWTGTQYDRSSRTIVYSQGDTPDSQLVQKDVGYSFLNDTPINATFERNNITFAPDIPYSAQVLVHRILPEVSGTGNLSITIGGAASAGATPSYQPTQTMAINTDYPWLQINQNSVRTVSLIANNSSTTDQFHLTAMNWQLTPVSESR